MMRLTCWVGGEAGVSCGLPHLYNTAMVTSHRHTFTERLGGQFKNCKTIIPGMYQFLILSFSSAITISLLVAR